MLPVPGGPFFQRHAMLVIPFSPEAVVAADNERKDLAYWLAYCELGPEPKFDEDEPAHRAYVRRLTERAREIFARLN